MKTTNKSYFLKQLSAFKISITNINDMAVVKGGRVLARIVILLLPVIGLRTTSAKVRAIYIFLNKLSSLYRKNGAKGACLILKVYAVTLQQSIGGHVVSDLTELKFRIARTGRGLPRVIPRVHREMILAGDTQLVKFYLSLFNLYRVIEFKGDERLKSLVKTIISPAVVLGDFLTLKAQLIAFVPIFYRWLVPLVGLNPKALRMELLREHENAKATPLLKSSPFTLSLNQFSGIEGAKQQDLMVVKPIVSSHPLAIHEAANALENNDELHDATHYFLGLVPDNNILRRAYRMCTQYPIKWGSGSQTAGDTWKNPVLGKLALKKEAAGKVRVFAMVDCWTQWLLKPLHDLIFISILPSIPQDGTKDQMAPVHALLKRDPASLFSLDLSAATDRLPVWLQVAVLAGFTGMEYALNWSIFLVSRDYSLTTLSPFPINDGMHGPRPVHHRVRYAVGQPMGALSSWAMLALTHHFIVQFSAYRVGHTKWFTDYAILGDDIVIGDAAVAKMYLGIMRSLGVGIGLHKSLLSPLGSACEFAKRTFLKGEDVSPVPLTEFVAAFMSPASAVMFIRKYKLTLASFLKAAGYGYKVLGTLHRPLGELNAKVRLVVLAMNIPFEIEDVEAFFKLGIAKAGKAVFETVAVIDAMVDKEFKLLKRTLNKIRYELNNLGVAFVHAKDIAAELLTRLHKNRVKVSQATQELVAEAEAEANRFAAGAQSFIPEGWVPGETFLMRKDPVGALDEAYGAELHRADFRPDLVLEGVIRIRDVELLKGLIPLVQTLQYMTQSHSKVVALSLAQTLSDGITAAMLSKYDLTASELFIRLIGLSKELALLPMGNLKYARIVDAPAARFTDGTYIRLWKSLSGLAQGTLKTRPTKPDAPKEFTGWW